jgi:hypothetical protein
MDKFKTGVVNERQSQRVTDLLARGVVRKQPDMIKSLNYGTLNVG